MTFRKKVLFYALLTLFTLAAIEGISRLAYYIAFAESYPPPPTPHPTLFAGAADLNPAEPTGPTRQAPKLPAQRGLGIIHPYYGFTSHFPNSPLNTMPPAPAQPDTVLIGLLGGSVAWYVVPYFQQALIQYFADHGLPKEPVVIPLAYPAMKQPQQLYIASFMLTMGGSFDLLVNLDGHNEMRSSYLNFTNDIFPFFPDDWDALFAQSREEILLAGQIRAARAQLAQLQQTATASPFRYTALYGILHRYQIRQAETRIAQLNYTLANHQPARSLEQRGPHIPFHNTAQVHQEAVRVWYRSSALLSRLAAAAGADYYHFLQPNQYIPNSKPLSSQEQQKYYLPRALPRTDYARTYPLLLQFGQELGQHGIHYFDLTQIFNDHPETLYINACCHLNPRGNELLAAAMVQRLAPTLRRHAQSEAGRQLDHGRPLALAARPPAPASISVSATKPDFQVSLRPGNLLVYIKPACAPEHTAAPFFLHITPNDPVDLPPDRRRYGFASQDFSFSDAVFRSSYWFGQQCVIEIPLPDYPIASLRTGQYNPAGEIWSTELTFPQ